jgi:hypothetical protein
MDYDRRQVMAIAHVGFWPGELKISSPKFILMKQVKKGNNSFNNGPYELCLQTTVQKQYVSPMKVKLEPVEAPRSQYSSPGYNNISQ